MGEPRTSIVVPTVGRPSLRTLLEALAGGTQRVNAPVFVVDDRPDGLAAPDLHEDLRDLPIDLHVLRSGGRGPAAARNLGWRQSRTPWVSFLDDDVVPAPDWYAVLLADLDGAGRDVAGSQGLVHVPLPRERKPTDWERSTAGLEDAQWITADLTYRRAALAAVGGFDERFPRAYREDADLGLRVVATAGRIVRGRRRVSHPVRPSDDWSSARQQAGNADDFLMDRLHGRDWRERASAPPGRRPRHVVTALAGTTALFSVLGGRSRVAAVCGLIWCGATAEFAWARVKPGPRDLAEVRRMLLTSAVIPFLATWHSALGLVRHRQAKPWRGLPDLVLFDRDGTLVHDVPYNGDPARVEPVDGARAALDDLRAAGLRVGVVTNQSGVASGRITVEQVEAVNRRVEELLGPFDVWQYCPHGRDEGCACRKPAPGMIKQACALLEVEPARALLVGDIGTDVRAAEAAGAGAILVPTAQTRTEEVAAAAHVEPNLPSAVAAILEGRW